MAYLLTSELKQRTGKVLDAAARQPQFVMRDGALFVIAKVDADAALLAAAEHAAGLKIARPGLTKAERTHRNAILRSLDDAACAVAQAPRLRQRPRDGGSGVA